MRFPTLIAAAILSPAIVFAAGSDDSDPPKTTQTASDCKAGEVFDKRPRNASTARPA